MLAALLVLLPCAAPQYSLVRVDPFHQAAPALAVHQVTYCKSVMFGQIHVSRKQVRT